MAGIKVIKQAIQICREAGVTPFIWGHRGMGNRVSSDNSPRNRAGDLWTCVPPSSRRPTCAACRFARRRSNPLAPTR